MAAANRIHQISVDRRRNEIQFFRNRDGVVRWYPMTEKRLDTLRKFDGCERYLFVERYYGYFHTMYIRRRH